MKQQGFRAKIEAALGGLFGMVESAPEPPKKTRKPAAKRAPRRKRLSDHEEFANDLLAQLCRDFPLGYEPELIWKNLRVSAGLAYYSRPGRIALSAKILKTEEQVSVTLRHEYAHLLAVSRYGMREKGHGAGWRKAMADLGLEPEVHHNYEVERIKPKHLAIYKCQRCGEQFARRRRLPRGRKYMHIRCGGVLSFLEIREATTEAKPS